MHNFGLFDSETQEKKDEALALLMDLRKFRQKLPPASGKSAISSQPSSSRSPSQIEFDYFYDHFTMLP